MSDIERAPRRTNRRPDIGYDGGNPRRTRVTSSPQISGGQQVENIGASRMSSRVREDGLVELVDPQSGVCLFKPLRTPKRGNLPWEDD